MSALKLAQPLRCYAASLLGEAFCIKLSSPSAPRLAQLAVQASAASVNVRAGVLHDQLHKVTTSEVSARAAAVGQVLRTSQSLRRLAVHMPEMQAGSFFVAALESGQGSAALPCQLRHLDIDVAGMDEHRGACKRWAPSRHEPEWLVHLAQLTELRTLRVAVHDMHIERVRAFVNAISAAYSAATQLQALDIA